MLNFYIHTNHHGITVNVEYQFSKITLKYNSWMVSFEYYLVSFSRVMKPGGDQTVTIKLYSIQEEFNNSECIIIYFLLKFSN